MNDPILEVRNLSRVFDLRGGRQVRAVENLNFSVPAGKTLALVGESGCGKTTTTKMLLRLDRPTSGQVFVGGQDIHQLRGAGLKAYRKRVQAVFQDPWASLSPRMRVRDIIAEPLEVTTSLSRKEIDRRVIEVLEAVGLRPDQARNFPHEFSGGQRQRIAIARALTVDPEFIIADEPISALDVSIQAQVLNLMLEAKDERGLTYFFITHDLSVVEHFGTRVAVLYLGTLCELADTRTLFENPKHPYTKALLSAVPKLKDEGPSHIRLQGEIPTPINLPQGCPFQTRCAFANARCRESRPRPLLQTDGSTVACHAVEEGRLDG